MKNILLLFSILFTCVSTYAQSERISLWPGLAPGTESRPNTESVDSAGSFSQVFQPELTCFPTGIELGAAPALLVCPGGGYRNVVIEKEGVRVAQWFQKRGFTVFVLKYRLAPAEALQDARRAMRVIRSNAAMYRIDPAKISVVGFSAGGHLSANLAVNYVVSDMADEIDKVSARPDFCAPIYGVFEPAIKNALTPETPPMFLAHAVDDNRVPVEQSLNLFAALKAKGIPAELHVYETGGHGFALEPDRGHATSWAEAFLLWLKAHGVEAKSAENF